MIFLLLSLGNLWIWRIFQLNIFLALLALVTSFFLYISYVKTPRYLFLIILFCSLCVFQYRMTSIQGLATLTKNEELMQIQRIKEYPSTYISFGPTTFWIPAAQWFEGRKETIVVRHMTENLFNVLDLNLYFFSNHPRERVGYSEFEKFPYILFPFFLYGIYILFIRNRKLLLISFFLPLLLFMLIGSKSELGPFVFFPFISCANAVGLQSAFENIKDLTYRRYLFSAFVFIYILVFIQIFSYAFY
jgi:hypothetical protein